jgi:hypothetical protein
LIREKVGGNTLSSQEDAGETGRGVGFHLVLQDDILPRTQLIDLLRLWWQIIDHYAGMEEIDAEKVLAYREPSLRYDERSEELSLIFHGTESMTEELRVQLEQFGLQMEE